MFFLLDVAERPEPMAPNGCCSADEVGHAMDDDTHGLAAGWLASCLAGGRLLGSWLGWEGWLAACQNCVCPDLTKKY